MNQGSTRLLEVWQAHEHAEFIAKDVDAALATMIDEPRVLMVPTGRGGVGGAAVRRFYAEDFLPHLPDDLAATMLSLTIGASSVVEEAVFEFTHNVELPWLVPDIAATGRRVLLPVVV